MNRDTNRTGQNSVTGGAGPRTVRLQSSSPVGSVHWLRARAASRTQSLQIPTPLRPRMTRRPVVAPTRRPQNEHVTASIYHRRQADGGGTPDTPISTRYFETRREEGRRLLAGLAVQRLDEFDGMTGRVLERSDPPTPL